MDSPNQHLVIAQSSGTLLLIEDEPALSRTYFGYLRQDGHDVTRVETGAAALESLNDLRPDAVLLDLKLPDMDGLAVLRQIAKANPSLPVIVITANCSLSVAIEAMREGAFDFLPKPIDAARLKVTVRNALDRRQLLREVERLRGEDQSSPLAKLIGASPAIRAVHSTIKSVAASKVSVFITGESGTGKELVAEAIHQASPRRSKDLVALNCAAIPKDLLESELFGHVRGAFTGATSDRIGSAKQANGGTLFLDEICDMPFDLQAKLLRFIQTGTIQPVGSNRTEEVDVRFIAATNRDPLAEVKAGRFREDLYYRLHVVPIHLAPLRERAEDALLIARHMLARVAADEGKAFTKFAPDVEVALTTHAWPGNIRQLINVLRNIVVLNDGDLITIDMWREAGRGRSDGATLEPLSLHLLQPGALDSVRPLWQVEKDEIQRVLNLTNGDVPRAANLLEVSASTIYRKLQQWREPRA